MTLLVHTEPVSVTAALGDNNLPRKIDPDDLVPHFIFEQQSVIRVVLVLDVSGSMKVLTRNGDPSGGIILLLSDGIDNNFPDVNIIDDLVNAGVIVHSIALGQSGETGMPIVAVNTGGKFFHYSETIGDTSLHDALAATVSLADIPSADKRIQLLSDSYILQLNDVLTEWVVMDPTVGNRTEFTFQWTNAPAGEQGIEVNVISPDGVVIDFSYEGYNRDVSNRMISIKILGTAQPGSWELRVHNLVAILEEVFCTISSYASKAGVEPIVVKSELSGTFVDYHKGELVTIYSEVRQGVHPIIGADIWAVVYRPGDYNSTDPFQLHDKGTGFYGIKISVRNNGTAIVIGPEPYSRAIPNLEPDKDPQYIGGYPVPPPWTPQSEPMGEPAPLFTRSSSGGSTNILNTPPGYIPGDENIPPCRIIDLRVVSTSYEEETITLTWTAPGDAADFGTAHFYDIRRANATDTFLNDFLDSTPIDQSSIIFGNLTAPQQFGKSETFIIKVPSLSKARVESSTVTYAFALKAIDNVGLSSDVSNIVFATLSKYAPPTGPPPTLPWTPTKHRPHRHKNC
ncbi:calcium-activated chloride channel regulator 1-like [Amphiura filiformis]|uniref:calcium-activated chloride channel regulator 1-like n=1 Tax=Amphiura filiformis TaxID=82378 RepID=UPI003B228E9F